MGLVKFGGGVSSISGKVGGTVYAHNRYGSYARTWKMPTDPATAAQQNARARMTAAATSWRGLSAVVRQAWEDYAAATPLTNRLGETIYLSGQAMFARSEAFVSQVVGTTLAAAPATPGQADAPLLPAGTIGLKVAGLELTSTEQWIDLLFLDGASDFLTIHVSPPVSAGVNFHKGPWTKVLASQGEVAGLANPSDPIVIAGVTLVAGQIRFVRVRQADSAGRLSPEAISGPITVVA